MYWFLFHVTPHPVQETPGKHSPTNFIVHEQPTKSTWLIGTNLSARVSICTAASSGVYLIPWSLFHPANRHNFITPGCSIIILVISIIMNVLHELRYGIFTAMGNLHDCLWRNFQTSIQQCLFLLAKLLMFSQVTCIYPSPQILSCLGNFQHLALLQNQTETIIWFGIFVKKKHQNL